MGVLELASAGAGIIGGISGAIGSRAAAGREQRLIADREAANNAWYNRNYYGDYLSSAESQNAIKRVKDTLTELSKQNRARAVVAGGTPERAIAETAALGRSVTDMMGDLAARGSEYRRQADLQKQQLDAGTDARRAAIASGQQTANAELMQSGINLLMNGLSGIDNKKNNRAI